MSSFKGMSDGLDQIGFPLVFLQHNEGKCEDCAHLNWFKFSYLFFDLVCCYVLSLLIVEMSKVIFNKKIEHNI